MSTYSSNLRIELITTGTQAGTWGNTTNSNYQYIFEQAITGNVSISVTSANQALTYLNGPTATASANQSIFATLTLTTTTSANFAVYAPPVSKQYIIKNSSSYTATVYNSTVIGNTTAAGTGVAIPAGKTMTVWSDGTNFTQQNTHLISPTIAGGTFSSPTISSATLTSPTMTTPALGTPASGTLTNCTFPTLNQNTTGSAGSLATTNWTVSQSGTTLYFAYSGVNKMSLDSSSNLTVVGNITAYGTP